jgi:chromosome segregation protein
VRLNSIKLSGFKSFAEPTHFQLPGQLVGVVGPNGCGKSNIMDAVRWVLGESRASELRGESMQDVIFNGTNHRKPASRASVELLFSNEDHRAGGAWNQYPEIAVRRVLSRDGTSHYFINNQGVRRRDVQDVFLGTGLGPRAYAIIGQGTISRIIESRPEELRLFLEEAAGVSKYKERRRETENRLSDTRENLTRLDDILRELNAQLEKLESQAEVARRYHALQAHSTLAQHQLWFLKREEYQADQQRIKADADQALNELEARIAQLRSIEADLETVRQAHYAAGDEVNQAQGRLYEASTEVGRLEAEIRYVIEGRQRVHQHLEQLSSQLSQWEHQEQDAARTGEALFDDVAAAQEQEALLNAQLDEWAERFPEQEAALRAAQANMAAQQTRVQQVQQQLQVLAAEQRHVHEQLRQTAHRQERLRLDKQAVTLPDAHRLELLAAERDELHRLNAAAAESVAQLQAHLPVLESERASCQAQAHAAAVRNTEVTARLSTLQQLQDKLKTDGKLRPWLEKHGLESLQALWSRLQVDAGWDKALEAALRERMGALEVSRLDRVGALAGHNAADAPSAKLTFYSLADLAHAVAAPAGSEAMSAGFRPLTDRLRLHDAALSALLAHWLRGVWACDSLDEALASRAQLPAGAVFVVPQGHVVSAHSVGFYAPDSEQSGLLARAQEIDALERETRAQALIAQEARSALNRAETRLADAQQQLAAQRREAAAQQQRAHEVDVEWQRLTQQAQQAQARRDDIEAQLAELGVQEDDLTERQIAAEGRFEELDMQLADTQELHMRVEEIALAAAHTLEGARAQQRTLERQAQEARFAARSLQARQAELARTAQTAAQQLQLIQDEISRAQAEQARLSDAAAQGGLQDALGRKLDCEAQLGARRSAYDDLTHRLRALDEQRLKTERELDPLRRRLTDLQLKDQAARLGLEQYTQFLVSAECDTEAVAQSVREGRVRMASLQPDIDRLQREIAALGAVNLAALDELTAARERKTFLDAQNADLVDAITTLEDAIRTIDAETRELLGGTFRAVNDHFGRMFPDLFGGGQARLVMTGDEILDAGVQVMAQPPGKKNQTIHLLSGGEKALTAIALVFAIFQLNPAPFCLLDEVDAPLDDANTERYARLVSRMSGETQFLFISHNKIAMEMAEQLIGVTMQEQGVSRIVAVDMESAVKMALA